MRGGWLVAVVAACSSNKLLIEIDTGSDVDTVELMIVDGNCTAGSADCAGIAPPNSTTKPTGNVYYLDGDDRLSVQPVNGHARFALEPGATDYVPRMLAVGFGSNDQPNALTFVADVDVSKHLGEWWKIPLEPRVFVQPTPGPFDVGENDTITLWRPPRDDGDPAATQKHATCAMIQHPDQSTTDFIGPPGDPDCDTFTDPLECDASWYQHREPAIPSKGCVAAASATAPCKLGQEESCIDGKPRPPTGSTLCAPGNVCVPDLTCNVCQTGLDMACGTKLLQSIAMVPHLDCTVPIQLNGQYKPCSTMSATVSASAQFPHGCSMPGLIDAMTFMLVPQTTIPFVISANGSGMMSITSTHPNPCAIDFRIDGAFQSVPSTQRVGTLLVTGTDERIAMPIIVTFTGTVLCDMGQVTTCAFAGPASDAMWSCAQ